ncbi:MAG: biotin transporter BioY [Lachnospiraceae bacterium]|nr:biotin transporter BioY [Lachnospiraceae bacterium]
MSNAATETNVSKNETSKNNKVNIDSKFRTIDLVFIAVCAALIAVCSWISIPMTVPFTLQTFAVFFAVYFLGGKKGTISVLIYILIGAVGVPVFAGFKGGPGALFGTTGGYIIGFIFTALVFWLMTKLLGRKLWVEIVAMVLGLLVCYAFGTAWFMIVYARNTGAISLATALGWCVFPFILPDLAKMALALALGKTIRKVIKW